jgi:hypothetical protein
MPRSADTVHRGSLQPVVAASRIESQSEAHVCLFRTGRVWYGAVVARAAYVFLFSPLPVCWLVAEDHAAAARAELGINFQTG